MKRTHLDFLDYLFPALVLTAAFAFILVGCTGLGTCMVPNTDCRENLQFYATQMTVYGTHEEAEDYPLPFGYWIEDNTQRVVKLRAWDGSWARWSYGGDCELSSGSGWILVVGIILSLIVCLAVSAILGFLVCLFIPRRIIEAFYA